MMRQVWNHPGLFRCCVFLAVFFLFPPSGLAQKKKAVAEPIDYQALQQEIRMMKKHYDQLKETVWASVGGQQRLKSAKRNPQVIKDHEFFWLLGERTDAKINPCDWLSMSEPSLEDPNVAVQLKYCKMYLSHLFLLAPYVRRNVEVQKCSTPTKRRFSKCIGASYYRKEVGYERETDVVDCWLTCQGLLAYINERASRYEAMAKDLERQLNLEKQRKEDEARRIIEEAKHRRKLREMRASKECKASMYAQRVCHAYSLYVKANDDLKKEREAGKTTGYSSAVVLEHMQEGVRITQRELDRHTSHYRTLYGQPFDPKNCQGWTRGANPFHAIQTDVKRFCGSY